MQNNISFVNTIIFFFGTVTFLQMQKGFQVILDQGCALSSCLFVAFFFFLALHLTGSAESLGQSGKQLWKVHLHYKVHQNAFRLRGG